MGRGSRGGGGGCKRRSTVTVPHTQNAFTNAASVAAAESGMTAFACIPPRAD